MPILRSIIGNAAWLTLAMFFGRGAVVVSGILIARFFGAEAFALFAFVHLTATSVSNIAMLGMMGGLPRFIARMQVDPSVSALARALIAMAVVALGLGLAVLVMAILPASLIGLPEPEAKAVLLALIFTIGLNNLLIGANNGLERFSRVTFGTLAIGVVLIGGVALAIWLDAPHLPLLAYLAATLVAIALLLPLPFCAIRGRMAEQTPRFETADFRAIGSYIGPMFLSSIMNNTGLWLAGRSLLGGVGGAQAFAEFALGLQWFGLALLASNVVSGAVMPRLTRNAYFSDQADQRAILRSGIALATGGAIIVFLAVLLLNPLILSLYGPDLAAARWPLILFVGAAIVASPVSLLNASLVAHARYGVVLGATAVWWAGLVLVAYGFAGGSVIVVTASISCFYLICVTILLVGSRS